MFMRSMHVWTVTIATLVISASAMADDHVDKLAARIKQLSPNVLSDDQRDAARAMVRDRQREQLDAANKQSSKNWYAIENRQQWEAFVRPRIEALRKSLGTFPAPPEDLHVLVTKTLDGDGFQIENLIFQSRPGLWVTANLYKPAKPSASMPGILICHAHHRPKQQGELQDMGMTWARAGCLVLVMDNLGHGERRQHPFATAADYDKEFAASRQDYYFRYDTGIQLHLVGESLIGWIAWDLMRGVDLLLKQDGIDPARIALLGAVAGGGDPAAVTAAIDQRIAAVVPFNFGGPQPETRFPLPEDAETSFNYAGSGGWESTRNLRLSARDGFLPWVIVGSVAPRGLIFAHEFNWDQPRDPVWKRLEKIYGFYDASDKLAFTHGHGELKGRPPEATHCTNIGRPHRKLIHPTFRRWFDIPVSEDDEYSNPRPGEDLMCMTPVAAEKVHPQQLHEVLLDLADQRNAAKRSVNELREACAAVLGSVEPAAAPKVAARDMSDPTVERLILQTEPGISIPVLILTPSGKAAGKRPVVVALAQGGKSGFLKERSAEIAALLEGGATVCLPDLREVGEVAGDKGRGRYSTSTGRSSTDLMLGDTTVAAKLRDLRSVIAHLRGRKDVDADRIAIWGDSFAATNGPDTNFKVPRRVDGRPLQSEPLGGMLALLAALFDEKISAVYAHGGLSEFRSVLESQFVLIPHDVVVPGFVTTGDLPAIAAAVAPRPLRLAELVDGLNRPLAAKDARKAYANASQQYQKSGAGEEFSITDGSQPSGQWLLEHVTATR